MRQACRRPGCPATGTFGRRVHGMCPRHRGTTAQGYGWEHQRERRAALPGAYCEMCGSTERLERDHIVPLSLGGREHPDNKRWLCRRCHMLHTLGNARGGRWAS